jgi:hypothetical protein
MLALQLQQESQGARRLISVLWRNSSQHTAAMIAYVFVVEHPPSSNERKREAKPPFGGRPIQGFFNIG